MSLENIGNNHAQSELRINEENPNEVSQPYVPPHEETHIQIGELLKSFVYGGVDGSSNILIVITSGISSGITAHQILAMCISVCVGDGIVMGLGDYLSAKAEIDFINSEEAREYYEVDNLFDKEKQEIVDIYKVEKYSPQDCKRISELYSTNRKAFVDIMMLQELHLVVKDPKVAIKCGIITFISFLLFGILPVLPFIVTSGIMHNQDLPWIPSICIGACEFISLGVLKSAITGRSKLKSAFQILIISSIATAVGYAIGFAFPS